MKPFNLAAAQRGEPICTRARGEAKFLAYAPENRKHYQVVFAIDGRVWATDVRGQYYVDGDQSSLDLFMAEKPRVKKEAWLNLYRREVGLLSPGDLLHSSLAAAQEAAGPAKVVTAHVEWEEEAP